MTSTTIWAIRATSMPGSDGAATPAAAAPDVRRLGAPARGRRAWPNTVDVDADVVKGGQPLLLGGPIVSVEQWSTKERSTSVSVP
jgi:hypothetical protein